MDKGINTTVMNLRVNNKKGFFVTDDTPRFSWNISSTLRGERQTAFAVGVASDKAKAESGEFDIWFSGVFKRDEASVIYGTEGGEHATAAAELLPITRYFWRAVVYGSRDTEHTSDVHSFETGLFGDFGKANKWITDRSETAEGESPSTLFRRDFALKQERESIASARLYATAAGCHIMYLNGQRVGNDYMAPGKTQCTTLLYYQTYDITDKLLNGENTVAAEVGYGWYNAGSVGARYGTETALKAKLVITYKNGMRQTVDTDEKWTSTKDGHTVANRYIEGQTVDGNKRIADWNANGCTDSRFRAVTADDEFVMSELYLGTQIKYYGKHKASSRFKADITEPVTPVAVFHPISVKRLENGYMYGFEQNIAGTLRVTGAAEKGRKITVKYSESASGFLYKNNGIDSYVFASSERETVEFDLVYHGFQYVIIEGLENELPFTDIEAIALSSCKDRALQFETSSSELNKYLENFLWTLRGNFNSTITDCPTREKNSWTGDAELVTPSAQFMFDVLACYENFQAMIRASQFKNGPIINIVPAMVPVDEEAFSGVSNPVWHDAIIMIPWYIYCAYGKKETITENYDAMKKYADYVIKSSTYNIADEDYPMYFVRMGCSYGDWEACNNSRDLTTKERKKGYLVRCRDQGTVFTETHFEDIATAYGYRITKVLSLMAEVAGKPEDSAYYADIAEKYAAAWRRNFVEEDGCTVKSGSQTSYALGIEFDLFEKDKRDEAVRKLCEKIEEDEYALTCGFVGVNEIFPALTKGGRADVAFKHFFSRHKFSPLNHLRNGSTTMWESLAGGSHNHYAFGCTTRWICATVLGIGESDYKGAGYRRFTLSPTYNAETGVTYAKGTYRSAAGEIVSDWKLSDDGKTFTYKCKIPANTTAVISLPITSESNTITEGGVDAKKAEGLEFVKCENGRAYFNAVSGEYNLTVNY